VSEYVEVHGLEELVAALLEAAEQFNATVMLHLRNLGNMTIFMCKAELADVRYTGRLEDSFVSEEEPQNTRVLIYPMAPHRMFVRMGTRKVLWETTRDGFVKQYAYRNDGKAMIRTTKQIRKILSDGIRSD